MKKYPIDMSKIYRIIFLTDPGLTRLVLFIKRFLGKKINAFLIGCPLKCHILSAKNTEYE